MIKMLKAATVYETIGLIVSFASLIIALVAFFTVQQVRIDKTTSDLNFCPEVMSGSACGFVEPFFICGDETSFRVSCNKDGHLRVEAEIFNKGLALATDVMLHVKFNGEKLNLTQGSRTTYLMEIYENGVWKQSRPLCKEDYEKINSWRIHIIESQGHSKISFDYPEGIFIEKPSEIIFDVYEDGKLVKEKTYFMTYDG